MGGKDAIGILGTRSTSGKRSVLDSYSRRELGRTCAQNSVKKSPCTCSRSNAVVRIPLERKTADATGARRDFFNSQLASFFQRVRRTQFTTRDRLTPHQV